MTPIFPGRNHSRARSARPPIMPRTAFPGLTSPRVFGPTKFAPLSLAKAGDLQDIVDRDAVRDDDQQLNAGVDRLEGGIFDQGRRNEDDADIDRSELLPDLFDRVKNRDPVNLLAGAARSDPGNDIGPVILHQLGADHPLASGNPLDNDS